MRGVPLKTQTKIFATYLTGPIRDMVRNEIIRPSGRESTSVRAKSDRVATNPRERFVITSRNSSIITSKVEMPATGRKQTGAAPPRRGDAADIIGYYRSASSFTTTLPYFAARAAMVPSAYFALRNSSSLAFSSLPTLRPTAKTSAP